MEISGGFSMSNQSSDSDLPAYQAAAGTDAK